jgi:hypothetical protein
VRVDRTIVDEVLLRVENRHEEVEVGQVREGRASEGGIIHVTEIVFRFPSTAAVESINSGQSSMPSTALRLRKKSTIRRETSKERWF